MHGAKDHFDPSSAPPLRLVGGPDDYDALAELFLGESARSGADLPAPDAAPAQPHSLAPEDPIPGAAGQPFPPHAPHIVVRPSAPRMQAPHNDRPMIEALVLGHLPVRTSPWIGQYARVRAEQSRGPVALLRVYPDYSTLDLYGVSTAPSVDSGLAGAVETARALGAEWVLQVDEVSEATLAADDRLAAITLLTSANEAAVIAAYRSIKGLSLGQSESGGDAPGQSDAESPRLRVAVMGATSEQAGIALTRLRKACSLFLGRPLELAASIERIGPAPSCSLYRGASTMDLPALLTAITQPAPAQPSLPAPRDAAPSDPGPAAPTPEAAPHSAHHSAPFESPAPAVHAAASTSDGASRLASHVPGLLALAARCPDDPDVELAIERGGRLAVLRRDTAPDAFQRLVAAVAWARRHLELIALTAPAATPVDVRQPPIGRFFTAEPRAARPLLETDVRVHVLARPTTPSDWVCLELN